VAGGSSEIGADELAIVRDRLPRLHGPRDLLEQICAFSPWALAVYDTRAHFVLANQAFGELFGSEPPSEYTLFEDRQLEETGALELIRRAYRGERVLVPAFWYATHPPGREGRRVGVETTLVPIRDERGEVACIGALFHDATEKLRALELAESRGREVEVSHARFVAEAGERARAEWEALRNEERLRLALEATGIGIWEAEEDNPELVWDERLRAMYGAPAHGPITREQFYRYIHPDDRKRVHDAFQAAKRPGGPSLRHLLFRIRRGTDGAERWFIGSGLSVFEQDRFIRFVGTTWDVTDQRLAEEALRQSEERLRLATEAANLGIWEWTREDGGSWDPHALELFDLPPETVTVSLPLLLRRVHPADRERIERELVELHTEGSEGHFLFEFRVDRPGAERWVQTNGRTFFEAGRLERVIGCSADITERKHNERELRRLYEEASAAVAARDEFLSIASHELKTPLTPLQLQLDRVARLLGPASGCDPKAHSGLALARRQIHRLTRLIDSLLDTSRLTAGRIILSPEELDLVALVGDVAERFQADAASAHSALELQLPGPVIGHWDRLRVEQVVTNLLSNALKYGAGHPIELRVEAREEEARLSVRDHGVGIPAEERGRLFTRFGRTGSARHFGGLGLGLYISRQLVEAHGGTIEVTSEPGVGATFTVRLPFAPPPPETAQMAER